MMCLRAPMLGASAQNPLWAHRTQLVRATQSESVLQEGPWVLGMHWLDGVGEEGAELALERVERWPRERRGEDEQMTVGFFCG